MEVFVSGATGVLGRATIPALIAANHTVRGMARTPDQQQWLRQIGAEPVAADLFGPDSLRRSVAGCDVILHLASKIPAPPAAQSLETWRENDRIRREGTHNLVEAALAMGVSTFIYPSAVFVYPDSGDSWLDASTPIAPPAVLISDVDAEREIERFTTSGGRGIVLRLGRLYGPNNPATRALLNKAREGVAVTVGADDAYESWICATDAASAFVAASANAPAGIYDVVDDEPLRRKDEAVILAQTVGRLRLTRTRSSERGQLTGALDEAIGRGVRVSNRRFKDASGWAPRYPSLREGLAMVVAGESTSAVSPA